MTTNEQSRIVSYTLGVSPSNTRVETAPVYYGWQKGALAPKLGGSALNRLDCSTHVSMDIQRFEHKFDYDSVGRLYNDFFKLPIAHQSVDAKGTN